MTLKQAKILTDAQVKSILSHIANTRYPARNEVMFLLSVKAGLRACEIAGLTWNMVLNSEGEIGDVIELHNNTAKKKGGRQIPIHIKLRKALNAYYWDAYESDYVITSERGERMHANSIVNWFAALYGDLELLGCSSHSGRRTFITKAAKSIHKVGGSLRDVQLLAGHSSINMTQRYIEGDTDAQRRLVGLI